MAALYVLSRLSFVFYAGLAYCACLSSMVAFPVLLRWYITGRSMRMRGAAQPWEFVISSEGGEAARTIDLLNDSGAGLPVLNTEHYNVSKALNGTRFPLQQWWFPMVQLGCVCALHFAVGGIMALNELRYWAPLLQ